MRNLDDTVIGNCKMITEKMRMEAKHIQKTEEALTAMKKLRMVWEKQCKVWETQRSVMEEGSNNLAKNIAKELKAIMK